MSKDGEVIGTVHDILPARYSQRTIDAHNAPKNAVITDNSITVKNGSETVITTYSSSGSFESKRIETEIEGSRFKKFSETAYVPKDRAHNTPAHYEQKVGFTLSFSFGERDHKPAKETASTKETDFKDVAKSAQEAIKSTVSETGKDSPDGPIRGAMITSEKSFSK